MSDTLTAYIDNATLRGDDAAYSVGYLLERVGALVTPQVGKFGTLGDVDDFDSAGTEVDDCCPLLELAEDRCHPPLSGESCPVMWRQIHARTIAHVDSGLTIIILAHGGSCSAHAVDRTSRAQGRRQVHQVLLLVTRRCSA